MMREDSESSSIHACAIVLGTTGILIRGTSGSGKSLLAHNLIANQLSQQRFACWVADDRVHLRVYGQDEHPAVLATAPDTIKNLSEVRYWGIESVAAQTTARIDLVADLTSTDYLTRMPEKLGETRVRFGHEHSVLLPVVQLPQNDIQHAQRIIEFALMNI